MSELIRLLREYNCTRGTQARAADQIEQLQARVKHEKKVKDYCMSKIYSVSHLDYIVAMERKFKKTQEEKDDA